MVVAFGLVLLTFGVFFDAAQYGFLPVDDPVYIETNSWVAEGLTPVSAARSFVEVRSDNYMPLTQISWMLDSSLFGMDSKAFHRTSVLLHVVNTVLLFLVLTRMTSSMWPSAFVAALFAVHPLHIESVVWISARKDVLSTLLWILTMGIYTEYVRRGRSWRYAIVCAMFALGLFAKQMLVTLPCVLLLCDYWPLNRFDDHRITLKRSWELFREKIPLFALVVVFSLATLYAQSQSEAMRSLEQVPLVDRTKNTPVAYVAYLIQTVVPIRLQAVGYRTPIGLPLWQVAGALAFLAATTVCVVLRMRRWPWLFTGWFWFLGTMVPVIGLISIGANYRADRYTYVSLIGLFLLVAWSAQAAYDRWTHPNKHAIARGTAGIVLLATTILCWRQVGLWADNTVLLSRTIELDPGHTQSRYALATEYYDQGDYRAALEHYALVAERDPNVGGVSFRMGSTLYHLGDYPLAERWYRTGLETRGDSPEAWLGLGMVQAKQRKMEDAAASFAKALELRPGYAAAQEQLDLLRRGAAR